MLIQRLKSGSQAEITIRVSGQLETFTVEASPKNKSLFVTDGYNRPVNAET